MRRNRLYLILLFVFSSILFVIPNRVSANVNSEYTIEKYDINIVVNEDNTLFITENIIANYNVEKHGIFRKIPIRNTVVRNDGTKSKNLTKLTDVKVNAEFSSYIENGYTVIKIGDPNLVLTGMHSYEISYLYNLGKDPLKEIDEFYFNLIGPEWDTSISNVTFTITMPKEFDSSKLGFSSGAVGSTDSSNVNYEIEGNVISCIFKDMLLLDEVILEKENFITNPFAYLYFRACNVHFRYRCRKRQHKSNDERKACRRNGTCLLTRSNGRRFFGVCKIFKRRCFPCNHY